MRGRSLLWAGPGVLLLGVSSRPVETDGFAGSMPYPEETGEPHVADRDGQSDALGVRDACEDLRSPALRWHPAAAQRRERSP